jgi:predicted HTH domain antitoxin
MTEVEPSTRTFRIEVELPSDLIIALNRPIPELTQDIKTWVVLALFLEGHISSGKAAELLQMTKSDFLDLLDQRHLPYLDWNEEELHRELEVDLSPAPYPTR